MKYELLLLQYTYICNVYAAGMYYEEKVSHKKMERDFLEMSKKPFNFLSSSNIYWDLSLE